MEYSTLLDQYQNCPSYTLHVFYAVILFETPFLMQEFSCEDQTLHSHNLSARIQHDMERRGCKLTITAVSLIPRYFSIFAVPPKDLVGDSLCGKVRCGKKNLIVNNLSKNCS